MSTKTRFEKEAKGNSEMAYSNSLSMLHNPNPMQICARAWSYR